MIDQEARFSFAPVNELIRFFRSFKRHFIRIQTLVSRRELKGVLASSSDALPRDAKYKSGDNIYSVIGGSIPQKVKVYGATTGGYSVVYTVLDDDTLEPYCLKSPRTPVTSQSDLDQIFQEARTWISLGKHPHIVFANSLSEINGCINILMEYVPGQNLSQRIKESPLPTKQALNYAVQLCRGLAYAQVKLPGFVHGDIKPSNCLLTHDNVLKITDFGQAKSIVSLPTGDQPNQKTQDSVLDGPPDRWAAGTPPYMAPEQFDAAGNTDVRTDIYSFGVSLYQMLTGQRPFDGQDHDSCYQQHKNEIPRDVRSVNPDVPSRLSNLVMSCLSKSPSDRPDNFSALEAELEAISAETFQETVSPTGQGRMTGKDLLNRAAALILLELFDDALECLDQALAIDSRSAVAWALKGRAVSLTGSYGEALTCLRRALSLDANLPFAWNEAAQTLAQLGNVDAALSCSGRAVALQKDAPSFWSIRGSLFAQVKDFDSASACLERAIELDPHHAAAHLQLGSLHSEQGRPEKAVAPLKRVVTLTPHCLEARCKLVDVYSQLGSIEEAIEVCRDALSSQPECAELRSKLKVAYREVLTKHNGVEGLEWAESQTAFITDLGEPDAIVSRCISFLSSNNYDPKLFYVCAFEIDNSADALRTAQTLDLLNVLSKVRQRLSENRYDRKTFYWLGRLYYTLDCYDECIEIFSQSIQRFGQDDKSFYYLAACQDFKGNYEQALAHYKQVLILDPQCHLTPDAMRNVEANIAAASRVQADSEFVYQA